VNFAVSLVTTLCVGASSSGGLPEAGQMVCLFCFEPRLAHGGRLGGQAYPAVGGCWSKEKGQPVRLPFFDAVCGG
jgi:hypothetical protein